MQQTHRQIARRPVRKHCALRQRQVSRSDSFSSRCCRTSTRTPEDFDVIHSHIDYWSFPFARLSKTPSVSTMHGRLDLEDLKPIYTRYKTVPLISISDGQRMPVPFMNWISTVHHGLPRDLLNYSKGPGKYLAFLGRISPEKRPDLAIDIARKAGIPN